MPEESMLERFKATRPEREAIRGFLDWLRSEHGIVLARWSAHYDDRLEPAAVVVDDLVAEFLGIDQQRLEQERRALYQKH